MLKDFIKGIKSIFTHEDAVHIECKGETKSSIAEPVLSFVNAVKNNPDRFSFEGVVNPNSKEGALGGCFDTRVRKYQADNYGAYTDLYKFTDKKLNQSYEMFIYNDEAHDNDYSHRGQYTTQPNYITYHDKRLSFITQQEWLFIEESLYLPYMDRMKEISDKKRLRKSINHERKMKKERKEWVENNKKQRQRYCDMYCEEED